MDQGLRPRELLGPIGLGPIRLGFGCVRLDQIGLPNVARRYPDANKFLHQINKLRSLAALTSGMRIASLDWRDAHTSFADSKQNEPLRGRPTPRPTPAQPRADAIIAGNFDEDATFLTGEARLSIDFLIFQRRGCRSHRRRPAIEVEFHLSALFGRRCNSSLSIRLM